MDEERVFSLSYEQLTRFAERRIRECNLDSQGAIYLCESAKAGAVFIAHGELFQVTSDSSRQLIDLGSR